jgi:aspartate kinase
MKFGGTSMAGTERIRRVANIVRAQAAPKPDGTRDQVVVVVSAMAGETDRLVNFCREANPMFDPAEYDV